MPGDLTDGSGRFFSPTFATPDRSWAKESNGTRPRNWVVVPYEPPKDVNEDDEPQKEVKIEPLRIKSVDNNIANNTQKHNTESYEIIEAKTEGDEEIPGQLVVRRAQEFLVTFVFDRDYDQTKDKIRLVLEIGTDPTVSKGTQILLTPTDVLRPRHWCASLQSVEGPRVTMAILTPPECLVGRWFLTVESWMQGSDSKREIYLYKHPRPIHILFNPFCRDDSVYMENEVHLDEYITNESGKIYTGNHKQIGSKPWNFGQFEDPVLECCMDLLDKGPLDMQSRGSSIAVIRFISKILNSEVVSCNWSGIYPDGVPPTHWTGSAPIFEEYHNTSKPVLFGQCWVLSGLCTTVCRALGIPCRSVTNFRSAHDCDGSTTIDIHWDSNGEAISHLNKNSTWSFHVWNEAWTSRPDLPTGHGGWQAIDATPQETSEGVFCAGPVSVKSIKEGNIGIPYDGALFFTEVNAHRNHWMCDEEGNHSSIVQKNNLGKKISTKLPRGEKKGSKTMFSSPLNKDDNERMDITSTYKYDHGTEEERASVYRANTQSTKPGVHDYGVQDVKFTLLNQRDDIIVGNSFDVVLHIQNKSRVRRTVNATVSICATHYTGIPRRNGKIKTQKYDISLDAIKAEEAVMRIQAEEYFHLVSDQVSFMISVFATVEETNQVFADQDDFRLRRPDLDLEFPLKVKVGQPFDVLVKFQNPTPEHLTSCEWMFEGPCLQKSKKISHKDLEPYDKADVKFNVVPRKSGTHQLVVSFDSKQLRDVTGSALIVVSE